MALPNIFKQNEISQLVSRIDNLTPASQASWGKMDVAQMLAHLNVMFELALENKHPKPNFFIKFILKTFVKRDIVNEKPYKKNSGTAPEMVIKDQRDFGIEKQRLIKYLENIATQGESYFQNREHPSFGKLTTKEWSNTFYKHITHHLKQFNA